MAKRRRRFRRIPWPLIGAYLALGAILGGVLIASTVLTVHRRLDPISMRMEFEAALLNRTFDLFVGFWFFVLGSCIGSFLNVVAYRVPRGMSLIGASRCPHCCVSIQSRDNVPVLGWIGLRGRCRACRLRISVRYPMVEAIAGLVFLVIYLSVIWYPTRIGLFPTPYLDSWASPQVYAHLRGGGVMLLASWMLALALVRMDRERIPLGLAGFGWIAAIGSLAIPGCFDFVHSVRHDTLGWWDGVWMELRLRGVGSLVGASLGMLLFAVNRTDPHRSFTGAMLIGTAVGASLGWVAVIFSMAMPIVVAAMRGSVETRLQRILNPYAWLLGATLFLCMASSLLHRDERWLHQVSNWLSDPSGSTSGEPRRP